MNMKCVFGWIVNEICYAKDKWTEEKHNNFLQSYIKSKLNEAAAMFA
jgi:hypothetical protein